VTVKLVRGEEAPHDRLQQEIKELMATLTFDYTGATKFCRTFCRDFPKQTELRIVDPIIETDDFEGPALEAYKRKCPDLQLNTETGDQFGNLHYGTRHFKLYRVDINNQPADGKEYLFYYDTVVASKEELEALRDPRTRDSVTTYEGGQFYLVDFKSCQIRGGVPVGKMGGFSKGIASYNGIAWYKGKFRIVDLAPISDGYYHLALWTYKGRPEHERQFDLTCATQLSRYTHQK
jgi:hypothetical protein